MSKWKDIGTLLLEYGILTPEELEEGLKHQKETGLRLGEALAELGKVSMEQIDWVLSKQLDIPFVIVDDIKVNIELIHKFQKEFLLENRILPLYETDDQVSIVTDDPFNEAHLDSIRDSFGKEVNISTGSGGKITEILKHTFKKVGLPELTGAVEGIIERIKETSFYRLDFLLDKEACRISVYGAQILKTLQELKGQFTNEDVFSAFNDLDIPFLYEQSFSNNRRFLAVYPMLNEIEMETLPAVIGQYGLFRPAGTIFSDAHVYGLSTVFPLEKPVPGYPYLATKRGHNSCEQMIYVPDAVPDVSSLYVTAYIPERCPSCSGSGCRSCNELGYRFSKIEGRYSTDDLKEKLKEVQNGKD